MVVHMIYLESYPRILIYPRPWGVELVSKHTFGEIKASSEVSCVLLGQAGYLDFLWVVGFPIGLNLEFSLSSWFPNRFESEDHAIPWFYPKLRFSLSSCFPHRFEFEDHAIHWFCPKLRFSLSSWFPHRFESEDHAIPWLCPKLRIFFKFRGLAPRLRCGALTWCWKPLELPMPLVLRSVAPSGTLYEGNNSGLLEMTKGLSVPCLTGARSYHCLCQRTSLSYRQRQL